MSTTVLYVSNLRSLTAFNVDLVFDLGRDFAENPKLLRTFQESLVFAQPELAANNTKSP